MWNDKKIEEFIKKAETLGSVPGLANIQNLMEELGNVQEQLSIIHVAGTNGKGSTCAMLEAVLQRAGYCTGRYSSPAVFCYEERFQVNGENISRKEFSDIIEEVAAACERMAEKGFPHPTLFEIETAAAFVWFFRKKCQIVILETGLGGRLDATNIIRKPLCSVIVSVSMDHMAILGDTLEKIAMEKAGIIKEGCPVVTIEQQPEAEKVFRRVSREKHADLVVADTGAISNVHYEGGYLVFDWKDLGEIKLSLLGAYQPENAVCAIATAYLLNRRGFCISDAAIRQGLEKVCWPGRFQVINRNPLIVIDGAHNEDAAKKLRKTLEIGFTNRKIIYIIGVLADKEHEKILQCMLPLAQKVYTVTPDNPRALPGETLCKEARKYHENVEFASDMGNALMRALEDTEKIMQERKGREQEACTIEADKMHDQEAEPMVLAFGSLSYLGDLKKELEIQMAGEM